MSPSKTKPLKKGPLKNISPGAYFRNFTVNGNLVPPTLLSLRSTVSNTKDTQEVLISLLFLTLLLNYANSNVTVVLPSG